MVYKIQRDNLSKHYFNLIKNERIKNVIHSKPRCIELEQTH